MTPDEAEYLDQLHAERRCYAWAMHRHGGMTPEEAERDALEFYPYEPESEPYRWLVFHDHSWHWAMRAIHGDRYATDHPELAEPSPEYLALG
ncbi:hypothetical protein ACFQ67_34450 [Streptomyces sp. NPDC056488]|uniref:hypothetical protein n=1 Tax=unclassified Streptomyces TaxID=2593676 RepID=UPI003450547F